MIKYALYAHLKAKPGKEAEVEAFLNQGRTLVDDEPGTVTWYAIKMGPASFAIFDTFEDEAGRQAHLSGKVAEALKAKADELFAEPPSISQIDILAAKVPG